MEKDNLKEISNAGLMLRLVEIDDAEYIYKLRQNSKLNRYLSKTSIDIEDQRKWIENYKKREKERKEFYFIVYNKISNKKCGTVRIYNIDFEKKECEWGSFILESTRPEGAAYEVIDLSLNFIFQNLELKKIKLEVRKENLKAKYIYQKKSFKLYKEDDLNEYYQLIRKD